MSESPLSPLKEFAHRLVEAVNPILGLIVNFEATDAQVSVVDFLLDEFDIPPETDDAEDRNAFVGLAGFFEAWKDWRETNDLFRPGSMRPPSSGEALQMAVDALSRSLVPQIEIPVEPIHELAAVVGNRPPVSHQQIAIMHDLRDEYGRISAARVQEELNKGPAKAYCRKKKRFPPGCDFTKRYDEARRQLPRLLDARFVQRRHEAPRKKKVAKESYGELAKLRGITLEQIARMKGVSQPEAEAELLKLGLVVAGMRSSLAVTSQEAFQQAEPVEDLGRLRESIRRSTNAGFDPEKSVKVNVGKLLKAGYQTAAEIERAYLDQTGQAPPMEEIAANMPETVEA